MDHFQAWLTKTQTDVASEDIPSSLSEAEKLLSQHQQIRDEIDNYTEDYNDMMEYGEKVTQDQTDAQYMFLREVGYKIFYKSFSVKLYNFSN